MDGGGKTGGLLCVVLRVSLISRVCEMADGIAKTDGVAGAADDDDGMDGGWYTLPWHVGEEEEVE